MKSTPLPMTLLMLAIFTTMVAIASTYPAAAGFMPFTIGIPAIGLCLIQLALDLYRRRASERETAHGQPTHTDEQITRIPGHSVQFEMPSENALFSESTYDDRQTVRREIVVWGYFLGLIAGVLLLGFRIAVPVFLITFLRFQAETTWRSALIYGGVGAVAMYLLFEKVLKVSLHAGFLADWMMAWLGS